MNLIFNVSLNRWNILFISILITTSIVYWIAKSNNLIILKNFMNVEYIIFFVDVFRVTIKLNSNNSLVKLFRIVKISSILKLIMNKKFDYQNNNNRIIDELKIVSYLSRKQFLIRKFFDVIEFCVEIELLKIKLQLNLTTKTLNWKKFRKICELR